MDAIAMKDGDKFITQELTERRVFDVERLMPGQQIELDFFPGEIMGGQDKPLRLVVEAEDAERTRILFCNNNWESFTPINIHGSRMVREAKFIASGKIVETWYLEVAIYNRELAIQQRRGERPIVTPLGPLDTKEVLMLCQSKEERARALASFEDLYGWERLVLPKLSSWRLIEKT